MKYLSIPLKLSIALLPAVLGLWIVTVILFARPDADLGLTTGTALFGPCALLLVSAAAIGIGSRLSGQIRRLTAIVQRIADGDLDAAVPQADRRDELGRMTEALEAIRANAANLAATHAAWQET